MCLVFQGNRAGNKRNKFQPFDKLFITNVNDMETSKPPTIELRQPKPPSITEDTTSIPLATKKQTLSTTSSENTPSPSTKNRRPRCGHTDCKKRLGLVPIECRCGLKLCTEHRFLWLFFYSNVQDCPRTTLAPLTTRQTRENF